MTNLHTIISFALFFGCGFEICWLFFRREVIKIQQDWSVTNLVVDQYEGKDIGEKMNNAHGHLPKCGGRLSVGEGIHDFSTPIVLSTGVQVAGIEVREKAFDNAQIYLKDVHYEKFEDEEWPEDEQEKPKFKIVGNFKLMGAFQIVIGFVFVGVFVFTGEAYALLPSSLFTVIGLLNFIRS